MQRKWTLPLLLGLLTGGLMAVLLWPQEVPTVSVVTAARDLGAGAVLTAADLSVITMPADQAPADAVADPAVLTGQTLAVVRFAGEAVTPRHLGPAVALAPDERGVAVQVQADTGLAGLLRPGMTVGVVATLEEQDSLGFAKAVLDNLRVVYVPPTFQAQPALDLVTVDGTGTSGATQVNLDKGVIVLAVPMGVVEVRYEEAIHESAQIDTNQDPLAELIIPTEPTPEPKMVRVSPVELLAALNAAGASFTLVLMPEGAEIAPTVGVRLSELLPPSEDMTNR